MRSDKAATNGTEVDRAVDVGNSRSRGRKKLLMRQRRLPVALAGLITLLLLPVLIFLFILAGNYVIGFAMNSMRMDALFKHPSAVIDGGLLLSIMVAVLVSGSVFRRLRWRVFPYDGSICGGCGYDLRGSVTGLCPECGRKPQPDIEPSVEREPDVHA